MSMFLRRQQRESPYKVPSWISIPSLLEEDLDYFGRMDCSSWVLKVLVHTLGLHRALRLALLNDVITAEEACAAGLVARVVEDDELAATADAIAAQLAAGPAGAQAATKQLLRTVAEESPESVLRAESLSIRARAGDFVLCPKYRWHHLEPVGTELTVRIAIDARGEFHRYDRPGCRPLDVPPA